MPLPLTAADTVGERRHPLEHLVHLRDDVLAVHLDRLPLRRAQRNVQHRAVLGDVDLLAGEHRVSALRDAALLCELDQQSDCLIGDSVLRVIEVDALGLEHESLAPLRVLREQVAQVDAVDLVVVVLQRAPGGCLPQRCSGRRRHASSSQRAAISALDFWPMFSISSSHDVTNASAASFCRRAASASTLTPARVKRPITSSALPPSGGRNSSTMPWSPNASNVFSGIVLTVSGAASART